MLAMELARTNEVVYLDAPLSPARFRSAAELRLLVGPAAERIDTDLRVLRSAAPPRPADACRSQCRGTPTRPAGCPLGGERNGWAPDLVWGYSPYALELIDRFPRASSVYWTGDAVSIPGEEALLERATAVLCVSGPVYERHRARFGERVHFVPVACDFERYHRELERPAPARLDRRRIGYAGWVNARLDVALLVDVARAHPEAEVVVAGPVKRPVLGLDELAREPNVTLLGPQAPERVPALMRTFDVALIPYVENDFNRGSNPVKFYEYLALGKPVVATDIPTLRTFADLAAVVPRAEFVNCVTAALDDTAELFEARVQVAREHSFPTLAERLGTLPL